MIDIHCHVLHGVDDGPADLEASLELCLMAHRQGIRKIIATPHYIVGESSCPDIMDRTAALNSELAARGIKLEILPGSEAYICSELVERLKSGDCLTLSNSRYVLVELPMLELPLYTEAVVFKMRLCGYIPVIAHPERNRLICEKPEIAYKLVTSGCLMQVNTNSLLGAAGKKAKSIAELLVRHRLVHFVATDAHSAGRRRPMMEGVRYRLNALCGPEAAENIIFNNPQALLRNNELNAGEPVPVDRDRKFWQLYSSLKI